MIASRTGEEYIRSSYLADPNLPNMAWYLELCLGQKFGCTGINLCLLTEKALKKEKQVIRYFLEKINWKMFKIYVRFLYKLIDGEENTSYSNQTIEFIDVNAKTKKKNVCGFWIPNSDILNEYIRPDGSLRIAWQVECFDNVCGLKALPCPENDHQQKVYLLNQK